MRDEKWNILLRKKLLKNGAYPNGGCRFCVNRAELMEPSALAGYGQFLKMPQNQQMQGLKEKIEKKPGLMQKKIDARTGGVRQ